jgi:Na+/H+-dicarboxylate symporter
MGEANLLMICVAAFCAVFLLLAFLALLMKILINVFPEKVKDELDAAMLAAVSASLSVVYPQTKITKVEQVR